jgi:hypothetical protein
MAGKMFFMGVTMPRGVLLGPSPIPHLSEYLMTKRHPEWANSKLEFDTFKSFMKSARERASGHDLPMAPAIKLKAYLDDPKMFSLTEQEKQFFKVDLIPLITGKAKGEGAWTKVELEKASYKRKAEAMLSHIDQHRNWIVPYPIDGLKALLKEGILKGADVYEKNWCALHLGFLLTYERADGNQIKAVLATLQRDQDGRVVLQKEDEGLQTFTEELLKKRSF